MRATMMFSDRRHNISKKIALFLFDVRPKEIVQSVFPDHTWKF